MRDAALHLLKTAEDFYIQNGENSPELDEFIIKRKITEETVKTFGFGYAPKGNNIYEYAKEHQLVDIAFQLGLIRLNDRGYYDHFRDRIMLPIRNEAGQCIGFSGRSTSGYNPKYLNSPESDIFKKDAILYGLDVARDSIKLKDYEILVEGYMDMISLYDLGFTNTVSLMGYQLTDIKIERLKSLTNNIYVMMDTDQAGKIASKKTRQSLKDKGLNPYIIDISPFNDPVNLINVNDNMQALFKELINKAKIYR